MTIPLCRRGKGRRGGPSARDPGVRETAGDDPPGTTGLLPPAAPRPSEPPRSHRPSPARPDPTRRDGYPTRPRAHQRTCATPSRRSPHPAGLTSAASPPPCLRSTSWRGRKCRSHPPNPPAPRAKVRPPRAACGPPAPPPPPLCFGARGAGRGERRAELGRGTLRPGADVTSGMRGSPIGSARAVGAGPAAEERTRPCPRRRLPAGRTRPDLPVPRGLRRLPFCVPPSSPVPDASGAAGGCAAAREGIPPLFRFPLKT